MAIKKALGKVIIAMAELALSVIFKIIYCWTELSICGMEESGTNICITEMGYMFSEISPTKEKSLRYLKRKWRDGYECDR